jgi:hypothetical protein
VLVASLKKKIVLSSVFAVLAVLSACGKPEIRSKTMDTPTAPSTSPDPKVAEAENKAADAAAKLKAKTDPATAEALEAAAARRQAALDELAEYMRREGPDAQQIEEAKKKVLAAGGTLPADAAPPSPAKEAEAQAQAPQPAAQAASPAVLDDAAKAALVEQAARRAFAIAMIEPVMRANFQVYLARHEILRMQNIVEVQKKELTAAQKAKLEKFRRDYGLGDDQAGFSPLLERVDGVNLTFLAAPLALRSNWTIDTEVQSDKIAQRVLEMNISPSDEKVRFRSARLAVKAAHQEESISLMKAFLGYNESSKTPVMEKVLEAVAEILKFTSEPVYVAEIERVRTLLIDEYKKNEAAKVAPVDASKK